MLTSEMLQPWLDGGVVDVVAPELELGALREMVPGDRRLLVATPDDGTALLIAGRLGLLPVLRWTGAEDRNRALRGRIVVTSIDSLHVPSLRGALAGELADAARVVLGADRLDPRTAGNLGRAGFEAELLGEARLRVHTVRALAPEGALVAAPGRAIVVRPEAPARFLAERGGGVVVGRLAGLEDAAHRAGLPIRRHALRRPFPRAWLGAGAALRSGDRGFDVLDDLHGLPVPGRVPQFFAGPFDGGLLGSGALVLGDAAPAPPGVSLDQVQGVLDRVEEDGAWAVFGEAEGALLEDLVAVGALGRLRPIWAQARVADAKRFRSPFADREPAWKALADRYAEALRRWSLAERTRLALSDQGPRDLVELARALGTDAATVSDVLMDLDAANVIAARTESAAGRWDLQVRRGRDWGAPASEVLDAVQALRAQREALQSGLQAALGADGCTSAVWRRAATGQDSEPCGVCAVCDPKGEHWNGRFGGAPTQSLTGSTRSAGPSLDGLFGSLGAARPKAEDPVELARAGEVDRAIELAGSPGALYLLGLHRHQPPPGTAALPLPDAVADAVLAAMVAANAPGRPEPEGTVRRARSGTWTVQLDGPGLWRLVPRSSNGAWETEMLVRLAERSGELQALRDSRAAEAAWTRAVRGLDERLVEWLDGHDGVPAPRQLASLFGGALEATAPGWDALIDGWNGLATQQEGVSFQVPPGVPGRKLLDAFRWLIQGEDATLEREARAVLETGVASAAADRLLLRGLALLQPQLSAEQLHGWLRTPEAPAALESLIDRLQSGRRASFAKLAADLPGCREAVVRRAVALRRLPRELFDEALKAAATPEAVAAVLVASTPSPDRARRVWDQASEAVPVDWQEPLHAALEALEGGGAAALAGIVGALAEERAGRRRERAAIVALGQGGQLGAAATRLAALTDADVDASPEERAAFADIRTRAIARQQELVGPVVAALAGTGGPEADDAAFGAIEDAVHEGFGDALVALLARQHRRTPTDLTRALWLARAAALNGSWSEAERVYKAAAREHQDPRRRFETEFEGVFLAFDEGQGSRALRWLEELLATPWHQVLAPHIEGLLADDIVPAKHRPALAGLLEGTGSPFYSKTIRRLRG